MSPDLELVERVARRDQQATAELVRRLGCVPRMLAVRNRRLGSPLPPDLLADVAQDVIAKVWENLPGFRAEANLETWIYRFCEFGLMNGLRRRRKAEQLDRADELEADAGAGAPLHPDDAAAIQRGLDRVAAEEATVIRAKHFEDVTFEEMAHRYRLPITTIKSRYYRGLQRLRRLLAPLFRPEET